jgi:ferric-dicitrate binding protein FerR (iron transport regulator)
MECSQIQDSLSALLDCEIAPEEAARIESHLEQCAACRQHHELLDTQHKRLRALFAERRHAADSLADRVNKSLRERPKPQYGRRWLSLVLSAAAGFLIAVGIFRPWRNDHGPSIPLPATDGPAAENGKLALIVARAPIDVLKPGSKDWVSVKSGEQFEPGSRIRTKPSFTCAIQCPDDSEIRLNGATEVSFLSPRKLELITGQIMAHVAKNLEPFQVAVAATTVTALGTEFDLTCKPAETTLLVLEGSTSIAGKDTRQIVASGEFAKIVDGRVTEKNKVDPLLMLLTTRWVNEILMLKGRDNPELARRIDDILAQLGQIKGNFMEEQEIRGLGDRCVLPLSRYLQSPRCEGDAERGRRGTAARILADLAQPWAIPDLIRLLDHHDPDVCAYAAKGLERLAGVNQGHRWDEWRRTSPDVMRPVVKAWQDWWQQNQHRFPSAG